MSSSQRASGPSSFHGCSEHGKAGTRDARQSRLVCTDGCSQQQALQQGRMRCCQVIPPTCGAWPPHSTLKSSGIANCQPGETHDQHVSRQAAHLGCLAVAVHLQVVGDQLLDRLAQLQVLVGARGEHLQSNSRRRRNDVNGPGSTWKSSLCIAARQATAARASHCQKLQAFQACPSSRASAGCWP